MPRFAGVLLVAVVSVCSYGAAAAAESASGGVSLTLSSAAAPAATSTRLTIHLDRSRINAGSVAHVSGALTRAVNGAALPSRSVALYARQTNQQSYIRVGQATTTTGGRYSFPVHPSWSTAYQVRFGGGPNRAPSASAYQILRVTGWYFMARLPAWSELGPRVDGGDFTATINGVEYPHSVQPGDVTFRGEEWVWKPNGRCDRLETYAGVPDSWTGEPLDYSIGASNGATATGTVSGHQPATHLVLDITAAASIHVLADNDFFPVAVLATPRLHCTW